MQLKDTPQLLDIMLDDTKNVPEIYKATYYWDLHGKNIIKELQDIGLQDFRRRHNSNLQSFGATDLLPTISEVDFLSFCEIDLFKSRVFNNRITKKIPFWSKLLTLKNKFLNKMLPITTTFTERPDNLSNLAYEYTRLQGEKFGAKSINEFESSLIGNPEDIIKVGDKVYTTSILYYYLRYVYCSRFLDFNGVKIIVELGTGLGKQIEVLKKLYPDITFVLFDIPPQLYVCEQYLSEVFPDSVVSYEKTRTMDKLTNLQKGKIYICGNWKFPMIKDLDVDLFWNAASFGEMEPDVVANYLKYINELSCSVYLQQAMGGKEISTEDYKHGVLKATKLQDYANGLSNFRLIDESQSLTPLGNKEWYSDTFWKRD